MRAIRRAIAAYLHAKLLAFFGVAMLGVYGLASPFLTVVAGTRRGLLLGFVSVVGWAVLVADGIVAIDTDSMNPLPFMLVAWLAACMILWGLHYTPDNDVIRLGVQLVTRLDPLMSRSEARTIRRRATEMLASADADPDAVDEPPRWRFAFLALLGGRHYGHTFEYRPRPRTVGERFGLLIALHGHGGNFRVWLHVWKAFADEYRVAVVCPSFGYGNWEHPDSVGVIERCLANAPWRLNIDPSRVYLAGISQGGCGVGRAGAAMAGRFAGLIFLSPTTELDVLGSPAFADGWRGRPVLVVQGGRDHNVRPRTVDAAVALMRENGAGVTYHFEPEADHFLFFAQLEAIHALVGGWMGR